MTQLCSTWPARSIRDAEVCVGDLGDVDALPLDGVGLVTASALLDLMPLAWVEALAARLRKVGIPLYAALSYDGEMSWSPTLPEDAAVTASFNAHQRGDKGIGDALGPDSGKQAARLFEDQGFDVTLGQSPWNLGSEEAELHAALLDGIGAAAAEAGHGAAHEWTARATGNGSAIAGHDRAYGSARGPSGARIMTFMTGALTLPSGGHHLQLWPSCA